MFDGRMMFVLTAIVAIATLAYFAEATAPDADATRAVAREDRFTMLAGGDLFLPVLLNDTVPRGAYLTLVELPNCGQVKKRDDGFLLTDTERCEGNILISYCLSVGRECEPADVWVRVIRSAAPPPPKDQ